MFYAIAMSQILLFAGSVIKVTALFSKDMLILQSLYLLASVLVLSSVLEQHSLMSIFFNLIYVCVTIFRIIQIYIERSVIVIPIELRELYNQYFENMRPKEFLKFINLGEKKVIPKGEYICKEGDLYNKLFMMVEGKVEVVKGKTLVCQLSDYSFIGEMRYLTKNPMSANVKVLEDVTVIQWSYEVLEQLKERNNETYIKFLEIMGRDMTIKISQEQMVLK